MTNLTSKDELLAFTARRYKEVYHPVFGSYILESLSERSYQMIEAKLALAAYKKESDMLEGMSIRGALLISESLVNAKHHRLFVGDNGDVEQIGQLDAALTQWLIRQIELHNNLDPKEVEDDLKKTSEDNSH